jgi:hypothetical protein
MATRFGRIGTAACLLLLMIGCATPARAQDLADLRQRISSEVWVYRGETPTHGFLTRLTNTDLTLVDENNQEETIPLESVLKIERSGDSIWNGFAIGASIGLASGIGLSTELRGHTASKVALVLYGAGIYGLIGAGIDAMHVGTTTVYESSRRRHALTIAPSRDWHGAMVGWRMKF